MAGENKKNLYQDFWKCKSIEVPLFIRREPSQTYSPMHWHDATEIILMLTGETTVFLQGKEQIIEAGDIIIFNSGELHSTKATCLNTCLMLTIPDAFWNRHVPDSPLPRFENHPKEEECSLFKEALLKIDKNYTILLNGNSLPFFMEIFSFLHILYKHRLASGSEVVQSLTEEQRRYLSLVSDFVEIHYAEPIRLEAIAGVVGLQPNYFCRFFKKSTGTTFQSYVNAIRLQKIYEDLLQTQDSVNVIAERHGFTNERVFRREFKATFTYNPSEIRKMNEDHPE